MKPNASLLLILLSVVLPIGAQNAKNAAKTFDVKTNLMVLDEKGDFVRGIKESDVKIFESGVEQKLSSFTSLGDGTDIVIVADNTGSVRTQLDAITNIGKIIVANLRGKDNAQLIRFVGRDKMEVLQQWTSDKTALNKGLDDMYVEGGVSAVVDALYLASQDLIKRREQAPNRRYAVVLISDGEDRNSYYTEKDLFKLLENSPVQVFTIALTRDLPKYQEPTHKTVGSVVKFVNRLAAMTGGTSFIFRERSTRDDFLNALKALFTELRSQFVIKYTSANVTKDNNVRKLTAAVADGPDGQKRKAYIKDTIVMVPPK